MLPGLATEEQVVSTDLGQFADLDFCYLTTTGRVTGRPHTIEIWFALNGQTLYMLSGGGTNADWVKNLLRTPAVTVRIQTTHIAGRGWVVEDAEEDALARRIVVAKYQPRDSDDLSEWGRTALPVALILRLSCSLISHRPAACATKNNTRVVAQPARLRMRRVPVNAGRADRTESSSLPRSSRVAVLDQP